MENDVQYFTRRADEERRAAEAAVSPQARNSHHMLAEYYAERVRDGEKALALDAPAAPIG